MATKIDAGADAKRKDLHAVDPFQIVVDESMRGRAEPPTEERIIARAMSMLEHGQIQPVECRRNPTSGKLKLNLGFTRLAAARLIRSGFVDTNGVERQEEAFLIDVKIVNINDEQAVMRNIIENIDRDETTDFDDAMNQHRLRTVFSKTDQEICKLYNYANTNRLDQLKKLIQCDKEVQLHVHHKKLSLTAACDLLEIENSEERAKVLQSALAADTGKFNGSIVRDQVRDYHLRDHTDENHGTGKTGNNPNAVPAVPKNNVEGSGVEEPFDEIVLNPTEGEGGTEGGSGGSGSSSGGGQLVPAPRKKPSYKPQTPKNIRALFEEIKKKNTENPSVVAFCEKFDAFMSGKLAAATVIKTFHAMVK